MKTKNKLKEFNNFDEKCNFFASLTSINTPNELDLVIKNLSNNCNLFFRGIDEAKYRMYSSSQRKWLDNYKQSKEFQGYEQFIQYLIDKVKGSEEVNTYLKPHMHNSECNDMIYNEMFLLSLLQHYGMCSPLLDFSHDLKVALFFALPQQDEPIKDRQNNRLDDYVSLYVLDGNCDRLVSIQNMTKNDIENAESLAKQHYELCSEKLEKEKEGEKLKNMTFSSLQNLKFIKLEGSSLGFTEIDAPFLDFHWIYDNYNAREQKQSGLYILNTTEDTTLEQLMVKECKRAIKCYDINKNLIEHLKTKHLRINDTGDFSRIKEKLYCSDENDSNKLIVALKRLFENNCKIE